MPFTRWLLFAALLTTAPAFAISLGASWIPSMVLGLLLLLVLALTLFIRRLQLRADSLSRQQAKLQRYLQNATDAIAVLDQHMQPTYINPTLLSQCHSTETLPKELPFYLDKQSPQRLLAKLQLVDSWQGEAWLENTARGQRCLMSIAITPLESNPASYLLIARDISEFDYTQQALEQSEIKDPQTGLLSRALLDDYLQTCANFCTTSHPNFALLMLKFNQLLSSSNDRPLTFFQDMAPDISAKLREMNDEGHILARFNADTFAIIVPPHLCEGQMALSLNRLAHKLLTLPEQLDNPNAKVPLQTLIGISIYPDDGKSPAEMVLAANTALQSAARSGNNGIQFASTSIQQQAPAYLSLEKELQKAVVQNEFDLYYQPRISIGSNRVVGYEALLRWHNPKRGILPPQAFLALADETGLVTLLDKLAFKKSCEQLKHWQQIGVSRGRIALNIASQSLKQAQFVQGLCQQLKQTGVKAEQFELELHEDILLHADEHIVDSLKQLAEMGFHLTLDNFGVGVSSLAALKDFPLHGLKIAPEFIKDMEHNEQQRNITASLIRLASYLQLDVIATGIENEMQAYLLHVMGCDILQGHLFSKALPATEIPALLAKETKLLRKAVS